MMSTLIGTYMVYSIAKHLPTRRLFYSLADRNKIQKQNNHIIGILEMFIKLTYMLVFFIDNNNIYIHLKLFVVYTMIYS